MGISPIEFGFLKEAHDRGYFSDTKTVLEFGESNTHELDILTALRSLLPEGPALNEALADAKQAGRSPLPGFPWARLLYRVMFNAPSYAAIDIEPKPPHVIPQDLNEPFDLGQRFDLCINNGTSEHIFNQANFYKAAHDHTRAGGLMAHWTPCLGWINHGLYNVQPGFFHDMARENGYEILLAFLGTAGRLFELNPTGPPANIRDALACVLLRKTSDAAFRLPMQSVYRRD